MATAVALRGAEEQLQTLVWRALDCFVRVRRLRRHGIEVLGEKCSTVQFEHHGYGPPPDWLLEWAMRRLAQGVPAGAIISICPFDKPPPDVINANEIAPDTAAIAVSEIAAMQVLQAFKFYGSTRAYRFAVTWNPRPPRQRLARLLIANTKESLG